MPGNPDFAAVFDFDGTLSPKGYGSLVKVVEEGAAKPEAAAKLAELRHSVFNRVIAGELTPDDERRWLVGTLETYVRSGLWLGYALKVLGDVKVRPGVRECLLALRKAGIPIAIVSFGIRQFVQRVLERNRRLDLLVCRVCAARLIDWGGGEILGYDPSTFVLPSNKGEWSLKFAVDHGVPPERILAVGDSLGDCTLGHLRDNRLGLAGDAEEAALIAPVMGETVVTEDFAPVLDWFRRKTGLAL